MNSPVSRLVWHHPPPPVLWTAILQCAFCQRQLHVTQVNGSPAGWCPVRCARGTRIVSIDDIRQLLIGELSKIRALHGTLGTEHGLGQAVGYLNVVRVGATARDLRLLWRR